MLPVLAVVYIGISGPNPGKLDAQLASVVQQAHVERRVIPAATLRTIGSRGEGSHEAIERLHVDGVICGELVEAGGHLNLHLMVYAGDGRMKSYSETPLVARVLSKDELETLRENLDGEIASLTPIATPPKQAALAEIEFDEPATPAPVAKPPARIARPAAQPIVVAEPPAHEPAPVEVADADAVSASELEALGGIDGGGDVSASPATQLHLAADVGFGVIARSFAPGPATIASYSSSPVGALALSGRLEPTESLSVAVAYEHTLGMTSGNAPTSIDRWELAGGYAFAAHLRAELGLGHRGFTMDSNNAARTPDDDYNYLVAAIAGALPLGRFAITARLAFEPVLWGTEPTAMSYGSASRWAIDGAVAAELRATDHVFVRAAFDYQRFSWTWDRIGGAVDGYPSGTLSLGARY